MDGGQAGGGLVLIFGIVLLSNPTLPYPTLLIEIPVPTPKKSLLGAVAPLPPTSYTIPKNFQPKKIKKIKKIKISKTKNAKSNNFKIKSLGRLDQAEANAVAAVVIRVPVAASRPDDPRYVFPSTAPKHQRAAACLG